MQNNVGKTESRGVCDLHFKGFNLTQPINTSSYNLGHNPKQILSPPPVQLPAVTAIYTNLVTLNRGGGIYHNFTQNLSYPYVYCMQILCKKKGKSQ